MRTSRSPGLSIAAVALAGAAFGRPRAEARRSTAAAARHRADAPPRGGARAGRAAAGAPAASCGTRPRLPPAAAPRRRPRPRPARRGPKTRRGRGRGRRPRRTRRPPPPPPPPPPSVMPKPVTPIVSATAPSPDPRVGLKAGWWDAGQAAWNMNMVSTTPPTGKSLGTTHSDLAFSGKYTIQGQYNGFDIYDISNPEKPQLAQQYVCPGVAERRVGLQEPAVHVVGGDEQPDRLRLRRRAGSGQQGFACAASACSTSATSRSRSWSRACRRAAARTRTPS